MKGKRAQSVVPGRTSITLPNLDILNSSTHAMPGAFNIYQYTKHNNPASAKGPTGVKGQVSFGIGAT